MQYPSPYLLSVGSISRVDFVLYVYFGFGEVAFEALCFPLNKRHDKLSFPLGTWTLFLNYDKSSNFEFKFYPAVGILYLGSTTYPLVIRPLNSENSYCGGEKKQGRKSGQWATETPCFMLFWAPWLWATFFYHQTWIE